MSEELLARISQATDDAEKVGKEMADAVLPTTTNEAINFIAGWILGLEDVLGQIVREIDQLSARLDQIEGAGRGGGA